jgi:hypothetical protein
MSSRAVGNEDWMELATANSRNSLLFRSSFSSAMRLAFNRQMRQSQRDVVIMGEAPASQIAPFRIQQGNDPVRSSRTRFGLLANEGGNAGHFENRAITFLERGRISVARVVGRTHGLRCDKYCCFPGV